jgi:predicted Zn-dependent protease
VEALKLAPRGSADQKWRSKFLARIADIDMQHLDWKRALTAYSELSTLEPEDDHIILTLVDLYYKVGQPALALKQLDHLLVGLVRGGQGAKVTAILEELVAQHPTDLGLIDRLARLYVHQNRNQDAIALLDRLGEEQLNSSETQLAIATIEKILALNPPDAAGYQALLDQLRQ